MSEQENPWPEDESEVPLPPGRHCCYCDRKIPDGERAYLVLGDLTCSQCCGPDNIGLAEDQAFWNAVNELVNKIERLHGPRQGELGEGHPERDT